LDEVEGKKIRDLYDSMKTEADKMLSETQYGRRYLRAVDLRYAGQAFELSVPFGEGFDNYDLIELKKKFSELYRARYGYTSDDPIECVNWRLVAIGEVPKVSLEKRNSQEEGTHDPQLAIKGKRDVWFPESNGSVKATIYDRYKLVEGDSFDGPAIIEEKESTCVILPGQKVIVDAYSNLVIES
jgi:N-methylhydantoinase A